MKIRKAIITVAGFGTRFLPATKAQPKEMLPIVEKPIIQYLVEEAVAAGIQDIILVTRSDNRPIEDHFDSRFELEYKLEEAGKLERLEEVRKLSSMANFIYIRQKGPYGNATPLVCAKHLLAPDEPFVYMFGDDLVLSKKPCVAQLIEAFEKEQAAAVVAVQEVPFEDLSKYGIVKFKGADTKEIDYVIEKPEPQNAPSNYSTFGRFVFSHKIIDALEETTLGKAGELWLMDAITKLAKTEKVLAHPIEGKWLTTGDPLNYLKATVEFALARPDLGAQFKDYLKTLKI